MHRFFDDIPIALNAFCLPASQKFRDLERNGLRSRQAPLLLRQFLAEVLGTFLLVLFGDGSIAQYKMLDPDSKVLTLKHESRILGQWFNPVLVQG